MTRTLLTLTLLASAALAGCNQGNTADEAANNAAENAANAAAPIELPPSIVASKIYRCKDNSVLYIDWLSDNKSANVRTDKSGAPTQVDTSAEGATLKGGATDASITYNGQSCKA
jgi:curli biogenesis system outer membrane secretion channel CsgG